VPNLCEFDVVEGTMQQKNHVHENRGFCIDFANYEFLTRCLSVVYEKTGGGGRTRVNT